MQPSKAYLVLKVIGMVAELAAQPSLSSNLDLVRRQGSRASDTAKGLQAAIEQAMEYRPGILLLRHLEEPVQHQRVRVCRLY